jgi:glycosyltransferase involved in cell wall biosynthesis
VILPVFNQRQYIRAAMQSILIQTFRNWELIVVDDFSNDGTFEIIREFCDLDSRVKVIVNQVNLGIARSLNIGIAASRGGYIARMDSDDVSRPNRLELQIDYLQANPSVAVVGGNADFVDEDGCYLNTSNMPNSPEQIRRVILKMCPLLHPTVMCRREFLIKMGGYDERLRRKQDYDLWFRGSTKSRYANISAVVLTYRTRQFQPLVTDLYGFYVRCINAHRCGSYFRGIFWAFVTLGAALIRRTGYQPRAYRRRND